MDCISLLHTLYAQFDPILDRLITFRRYWMVEWARKDKVIPQYFWKYLLFRFPHGNYEDYYCEEYQIWLSAAGNHRHHHWLMVLVTTVVKCSWLLTIAVLHKWHQFCQMKANQHTAVKRTMMVMTMISTAKAPRQTPRPIWLCAFFNSWSSRHLGEEVTKGVDKVMQELSGIWPRWGRWSPRSWIWLKVLKLKSVFVLAAEIIKV